MIAYKTIGSGKRRVVILHDWFCDTSSWDPVLPYLNLDIFTFVFADLRGYGGSRHINGNYVLEEATQDVLDLTKHLGWNHYSLVGHSMTSLVVQRVAQLSPDQVERVVVVTPVPPGSLKMPPEAVKQSQALALASEEDQCRALTSWWGPRLGQSWVRYKVGRWRTTSEARAVAKYVEMYGTVDISSDASRAKAPLLAIAGANDAPPFRAEALAATLVPFYPGSRIETILEASHYPMQETPPLLAEMIQTFLGAT